MSNRTRISSGGPWEDRVGYSRAIRVGNHVYVSGTTATGPDGTIPEGPEAQTRQTLDTIEAALNEAGATINHVVRVRNYVTNIQQWEQIALALRERFNTARPAMTMVEVARLIDPAQLIEIEVDAIIDSGD